MIGRLHRIGLNNCRSFSTSGLRSSNIGKLPIRLAEGVEFSSEILPKEICNAFSKGNQVFNLDKQIKIKGPLGQLKFTVPNFVHVLNENNNLTVSVEVPEDKIQRALWGTTRALIQNHIIGTTEGHLAIVKFVGTGFRATIEDGKKPGEKIVTLKVGYPFLPKLKVPEGLKVTSPNPTRLLIEGADKQQVKLFAARIREFKKPEPYKGKGIFINDETIKLKEKKIK